MRAETLIQFLDAAADTKYITGPFDERGGVFIVGPPGSLKTTIIRLAIDSHSDAIPCSDLNVKQWLKIKDDFISARYTALSFPEFEKIYQRHSSTAANLEGIIKALVSEGYSIGPNGDPRMPRLKARALVVGGITTDCFDRHYEFWQKNGFLRRFIWFVVAIHNPDTIVAAIRDWKKIDLGKIRMRPASGEISVELTEKRSRKIEHIMRAQPGLHGTAYVLMKKIVSILDWKYDGDTKKVDGMIEELAASLSNDGDKIVL